MANVFIHKRKGKTGIGYAVRYVDPLTGKKKNYGTFRKYREAQQKVNELRALLDSGGVPLPKKERFTPLTFEEVAESLKAIWDERLSINELSQKTHSDYVYWLRILIQVFGDKLLCQITREDIEEYRNRKAREFSNVCANKHLLVLRNVFAHGTVLRAVINDLSRTVSLLSEKAHIRDTFIFPDELERILAASQELRSKFYLPAIILLGAEHGASKQEILSLEWSKIKFDFQDIGLIEFFRTKTGRKRTEYLMPRTRKALLEWQGHLDFMRHRKKVMNIKTDQVFSHLDGSPLKRFDRSWKRVLELAGIKRSSLS
ncbi:MAG: site-specific integrase [Nitrospina sp.]|jgi:integrase|nr:site-specific integrase [Nitrospina sp.]